MQQATRFVLAAFAALAGLFLLIPVVLMAVPFWFVAGLQAAAKRALVRSRPDTVSWQELMEYEPEVGWKPRGGIDAWAEGTPPFHVRTDADGWRGPGVSVEDADVIVFGDSFAFGHGADEDRFFANLTGGSVLKAIGANGYNMVQGLQWMRRYAAQLRGKTVAWRVYYGNDLYDNLQPSVGKYRAPFVRWDGVSKDWQLVTAHVTNEPWSFPTHPPYTSLLAEICCPSFLSDRVFGACEYLVTEAAATCHGAGGRLIVLGNPHVSMIDADLPDGLRSRAPDPSRFDAGLPDARLRAICDGLHVPFVALSDYLSREDHLAEDVHWNSAGHEKVHRIMTGLLAGAAGEHPAHRVVPGPDRKRIEAV